MVKSVQSKIQVKDLVKEMAEELAKDVEAQYIPSDLLFGIKPLKKKVILISKRNKPKIKKRLRKPLSPLSKPKITKKKRRVV